jgi:pimeloyl-ACP methyl ester carboxylesterase
MSVSPSQMEVVSFGAGEGLPILMLHEGLGSVALWREFPARLAEQTGRKVIAWSRLGYGNSEGFEEPYGTDFMHREADAAARLMQDLGIPRAHLFGHSDGASIALLLAARHPAQVAALVLEAPHIFVEAKCLEQIAKFGREVGGTDTITRMGRYHRDAPAVFRQWHAVWTDPLFPAWSIEQDIAGLTHPILLIQGEDDEYGTFARLDRIVQLAPQCRQLRLPRCGHSPHRDQGEAVLATTALFFGEMGQD